MMMRPETVQNQHDKANSFPEAGLVSECRGDVQQGGRRVLAADYIASQRTAATKQIRSQTDTYNYSELLKIINLNCDEPYFCPVGCVLNLIFINPDKFALSLIFSFDYKAKECKVSSHPLSKLLCYIYI